MENDLNLKTDGVQYIAQSDLFPQWVITFHEWLTVMSAGALATIMIMLVGQFIMYNSRLDKLLTRAFIADWARTVVTFAMGVFLYFDWADGVKILVVLRPYVLIFACWSMYLLLIHYRQLFGKK